MGRVNWVVKRRNGNRNRVFVDEKHQQNGREQREGMGKGDIFSDSRRRFLGRMHQCTVHSLMTQ